MLPGRTYYWRVDEWTADGIPTRGDLWSSSVADDLLYVDDMEFRGEQMWFIWWDGWGDPNNGSVVYYPETSIVHGGEQSMYLFYDNTTAPISQIVRMWEAPQDWTRKGAENLTLWLHGNPGNSTEPLYVSLGDSADNAAVVARPDPAASTADAWQQWSISLADLAGVDLTAITSMAIAVGDAARTEPGGSGVLFIDDLYFHPVSVQAGQ